MISKIWCIFRLAMENNSIPFWNPQFLCNDTGQEPKISNNRCVYKNNLKIFLTMNHYTQVKVVFFPSFSEIFLQNKNVLLTKLSYLQIHYLKITLDSIIFAQKWFKICYNIFMKKTSLFKSYFSLNWLIFKEILSILNQ